MLPSIQGHILKFGIRRLNVLHIGNANLQDVRNRSEIFSGLLRTHEHVHVVPVDANGVDSEWLLPQGALQDHAMLYLHGGAWFMGSARTHRSLVSNLAYGSKTSALSINYRLSPEFPFPAGLNDCIAAYQWLLEQGIPARKIIVAGDSAGGNLTLALLIALRDMGMPLPAGAIALSPATDLTFSGESIVTQRHLDPMFARIKSISTVLDYIGEHDAHNPLISPLFGDLGGLPPLLLHVGEHEILRDDTVRFAERARAAGVEVEMVVWPNMFHVFQMASAVLPEARQSIEQIIAFIKAHFDD